MFDLVNNIVGNCSEKNFASDGFQMAFGNGNPRFGNPHIHSSFHCFSVVYNSNKSQPLIDRLLFPPHGLGN